MEHNHTVYGPCPACDDWQVDIDSMNPDLPALVEDAIVEHDAEAHPGHLEQMHNEMTTTSVDLDLGAGK